MTYFRPRSFPPRMESGHSLYRRSNTQLTMRRLLCTLAAGRTYTTVAALLLTLTLSILLNVSLCSAPYCSNCTLACNHPYRLPSLKSLSLGHLYLCDIMWSSHLSRKLEIDRFTYSMASRSFLLVNLVIFLILVSLHLQQHATSLSRNGKTKKKGRRNSEHAERSEIIDDSKSSALPVMPSFEFARTENEQKLDGAATAAAARPGHVEATMDNNSGSDCVPADVADHHHVSTALQGHPLSLTEELSSSCDVSGLQDVAAASMESFSAQDSNAIPAADMEADASELPCRTVDEDCRPAVTADKIVLEEDGRLRLMEVPKRPRRRLRDAPFRNPQESSETHAHSKSSRSGLNPHHDSLSDLAIKEPRASHSHINVPKSISLSGNHPLIDCDPPNLTSSRSRVKSMDAMNDNTTRRLKTRKKAKGDSNMVKSAFTRLRREPSINSQDELNARVESFIATFNEKMRIQRQQSLLSFMQMVDRGG